MPYTLPFQERDTVKNLVFSILTKEYPLKIIELTHFIRKRYGKVITVPAVRKAVLQLVEQGALKKDGHLYSLDAEWILASRNHFQHIYNELTRKHSKPASTASIEDEISVFTFDTLNAMMRFWQDVVEEWFRKFKKGDYNLNCWQGAHAWEGLLHLDREHEIYSQFRKRGIKSHAVGTTNTPLDRNIAKFYRGVGLDMRISPSSSFMDKSYYVGTYGDVIIQAQYNSAIVKKLDEFFEKNQDMEGLDLRELASIANQNASIKLTVIHNKAMAEQLNRSILAQIQ